MKAHVVAGVVKRVIDDAKIGLFPPHLQAEFVAVPAGTLVEVGDLFDGTTFSKPGPSVATVATPKLTEMSDACKAQIVAGYESSALGAAHHYPAKEHDQANMVASVTASLVPGLPADWVTPFWCRDAAGVWAFRPHTAAQIQQAGVDGKAAITSALQRNAQLASQVGAIVADTAMTDADKIAAINLVVW